MKAGADWPPRVLVAGTPISAVSTDTLITALLDRPSNKATVVAFCNVHSVMTARRDPRVASALREADIASPDGMPLVWGLRAVGHSQRDRVDGPSFMEHAITAGVQHGWRHYFYGSTDRTLAELLQVVRRIAPGVRIAGSYSPPFTVPSEDDVQAAAIRIAQSDADLVWVGLGMPKQELWMQAASRHLPGVALLGVGAAFDFLAGTTPRAPAWMQAAGLEWLHRLSKEPRRMWRRYLFNNPAYLTLLARDVVRDNLRRTQNRP